ncbi:hypothetical protein JKF63_00627 [Porcisia hertigi]|uniref:F-box domain-containing protein n=1 Tax=Porcisia hertigi TaxID=2761500 RepID=A0A836KYI0_9TRYP|nr:hypothetical protein JKF63_00627 [Porcisia hertigi]
MLPRTDKVIGDSGSASTPSSQQYLDELASSTGTDITFVADSRGLVSASSPAPVVCVSLTFPPPARRPLSPCSPLRVSAEVPVQSHATGKESACSPTCVDVCTCGRRVGRHISPQGPIGITTAAEQDATSTAPDRIEDMWRCFKCSSAYGGLSETHVTDNDHSYGSYSRSGSSTSRGRGRGVSHSAEGWGILWSQVFPLCIAGYLCLRDVMTVSQVCRMANKAAQHPWVWRSLAAHHHCVQPVALERTFLAAARQWCEERPTDVTHRLAAYNLLPVLTEYSCNTAQRCWSLVPESTARAVATDDDGAASHVVEPEESDSFPTVEVSESFHTVQSPPCASAVILSPAAVAVAATTAASSSSTLVAAAVDAMPRAGRPELPHGVSARYLWQTTAAAMPSPSSPVSSPPSEDEEPASLPVVTGVEALPREAPVRDPVSSSTLATAASAAGREAVRPNVCASPLSAVLTSITEGQNSSTPMGTSNGTGCPSGENWRALWWATAQECLPPPSPAQLDGAATRVEATAKQDASLVAPISHRSLRCHPSCVMEMSAGATVDEVALAAVPLAALSGAAGRSRSPQQQAVSSPTVYSFTVCRATAERTLLRSAPEFPWRAFTQYVHVNRVQRSLSQLAALSNIARAELCRGGAWYAAYGALSRAIHVLFQTGSCRSVEHLRLLAETLVRRASLCRHRGHLYILAAFTDLSVAWMLCPDSTSSADLAELCTREELVHESPATWLQRCNDAAHVASPVVLLSIFGQVPTLFPQNRALCFCGVLTFYLYAKRALRHSLTHLLCRATEFATPGTEEELLVTALREVIVAQESKDMARAQKACATADYTLSLLPLHVRNAADTLTAAWVRDCFPPGSLATTATIVNWANTAPESIAYMESTPLEVRWLAWLVYEVQWFTYEELMGQLPGHTALLSIVLGPTTHSRADGLVRLSMQYANANVHSEDLEPELPHGTSRGQLAQNLLESALQLRPLHPTAALLLSRMHARSPETVARANAVLTDTIHAWAQRFSMLGMRGAAGLKRYTVPNTSQSRSGGESPVEPHYLHRRDRRPEFCFIPSELLVERSRCLCTIADMAEATEQHPSLSYPYQMRAAMAMDRGYHLAAIMELNRIMSLSMDANDIALQVRFLQDAIAMAMSSTEEAASAAATEVIVNLTPEETSLGYSDHNTGDGEQVLPSSLLSHYRSWMAKASGLLALLRSSDSVSAGIQQLRTRFDGRERRTAAGGGGAPRSSDGQVSRVASIAFSDIDEEETLMSASTEEPNATHLRAFLEDLLSPIADPLTVTAISSRVRSSALTP